MSSTVSSVSGITTTTTNTSGGSTLASDFPLSSGSSSSTATSAASSSSSSTGDSGDSSGNDGNEPTNVGSKSLIFGFAFFAILIAFLFASVSYQRWAARRQRALRNALGILDRDEDGYYDGPGPGGRGGPGAKPRSWNAYIDSDSKTDPSDVKEAREKECRWADLKPLAARWLVPTSLPPGTPTARPAEPPLSDLRFFPMFAAPRRRVQPLRPQMAATERAKADAMVSDGDAHPDSNALQVAFLIAMPAPPEVTRRPVSPDEEVPLMHLEIGVADVEAERELLS